MDAGHYETELILKETERELRQVYAQAQAEAQKKLDEYLRKFKVKDVIKQDLLKRGEITKEEYAYWRKGQICIGQRWQEMVNTLAEDYTNADKIAMSIVKGHLPSAYALNHNYGTFQVEKGSLLDTSYTLYDRYTVERLIRDNPDLLPAPQVDIPKDLRWNKTHIKNAIMQGVLQGEDLGKIAKRLGKITNMDHAAALRNARTMMTGAQNAGRVDSYLRAENMGIEMEQEWLATLDGRTRHSHRQMDGKRVAVGKKFGNGCRYPGDPSGPPWEVYNCRCTLVAAVKGIDQSNAPRNSKLGSMTYDEWKHEHDPKNTLKVGLQGQIGRATSINEINNVLNNQEWFRSGSFGDLTGCDLESAKSIVASYQQVFEKYPQLKGQFGAPTAKTLGPNTYAQCYLRSDGRVEVNTKFYDNWQNILKSYEKDVLDGWHPYGTTAEGIVTHEVGHAIDGLLAKKGILGGYTSSGEFRYASSSLKTTIMNRAAKQDEDLAELLKLDKWLKDNSATLNYVSEYATKNPKEWFAECFAEYITSANPRIVAAEFGKELEKLLGRLT